MSGLLLFLAAVGIQSPISLDPLVGGTLVRAEPVGEVGFSKQFAAIAAFSHGYSIGAETVACQDAIDKRKRKRYHITMRIGLEERFWAKVKKTDGCWIWTGALDPAGYGAFHLSGKVVKAHRLSLQLAGIEIPKGLHTDHLCRTPACVNPSHLEPVTPKENCRRGFAPMMIIHRSGKCSHGHEMTKENTYVRKDTGGNMCRACHKKNNRAVIKTLTANCVRCGTVFTYRKVRRARTFCGNKCRQKSSMTAYNIRQALIAEAN